jgi:pimeloyl-ACP methyl ester carboxylesterase
MKRVKGVSAQRASLDSFSSSASIESILRERLRRPAAWPHRETSGTISLGVKGARERWNIHIKKGVGSLSLGKFRSPTASVEADDFETLRGVLDGSLPGLAAFLAGRLGVRGNVGLALKLDLFFPPAGASKSGWSVSPGIRFVDGIETFFLDAGPRDAPVVILLHGLGATSVSMLPVLGEFARDHRVIAVDLPGFGESAKPLATYSFDWFAKWLVGFLDVLGIQKASLVGNSMGGRISIEVGLLAPHRVERVVLLSPSMAWLAFRHFVPIVRLLRPELAFVPLRLPRSEVMRFLRLIFADADSLPKHWLDAAVDEFLHYFRSAQGRIAFFAAARQIYLESSRGEEGFWDRLPRLKPPALFVWGKRDFLVPPGFAAHAARALPSSETVMFDDCGHIPQYEVMERLAPIMRKFFERR